MRVALDAGRNALPACLPNPPVGCALVRGIVSLAHAFHRTVVAEGVETMAHAEALRELGCDGLQGFGIARPMPLSELIPWIQKWRPPPTWRHAGETSQPSGA